MPRWNEADYLDRAKQIASQHVTSGTTLNDLTEKVARENALSPDEIRTLVRLSNVEAFRAHFEARKEAEDRNVDYEVGDAEAVIRRLVDGARPMPGLKVAADLWDQVASIPDERTEERYGALPVEKVAAEEIPVTHLHPLQWALNREKIAEDLRIALQQADAQWGSKIAEVHQYLDHAPGYGLDYATFCKDALALFGSKVAEDLRLLGESLGHTTFDFSEAKIASIQETHLAGPATPALRCLEKAAEARLAVATNQAALAALPTQPEGA